MSTEIQLHFPLLPTTLILRMQVKVSGAFPRNNCAALNYSSPNTGCMHRLVRCVTLALGRIVKAFRGARFLFGEALFRVHMCELSIHKYSEHQNVARYTHLALLRAGSPFPHPRQKCI